jgi:chemotaxis protein methyltransferase CheR
MALLEAGRPEDRVIATDVSEEALARGRLARYGPWSLRRLRADRRARWFAPSGLDVEVLAGVRDRVEFRRHNLATDPPPWTFDVVFCRNVLIYFEPAAATQAMHRLLAAVRPGGLLVLGPIELPLAASLGAQWVELAGATVLRRPGGRELPAAPRLRLVEEPAPRPVPIHGPGLRFLAAREAVRSGHLADAERLAREAIEGEGGPEPWLVLAQVAEVRGQVAEAAALLRRALEVEPGMPVALASLSALLRLLGKPGLSEMARAEALRALDGLPEQHPLRGLEPIPAGALRRALLAADPHPE